MLKLKRLKIEQYRNVRPGTELRFDDGLNLVLGQNASGKTTLLALLSAVCRSAFAEIADEEFVLEYELASERYTVVATVMHCRAEATEADEIGAGPRWNDDYEVLVDDRRTQSQLVVIPARGHDRSKREQRTVVASDVDLVMEWSFIAASLSDLVEEWARLDLRGELLSTFASTFRFDESLDCFSAMTGRAPSLVAAAPPIIARAGLMEHRDRRGGTSTSTGAFVPQPLARALQRSFKSATAGQRNLDLEGANQEVAARLADLLDAREVAITPNLLEHRVTLTSRLFRVEGFTFEVTRADGTIVHHDRLSYGQKRLLAFAYYLECNPHAVIADELVNGLHHRWIDAAMSAMKGRQAFLTSQNPLLFDYVEFESVDRVRSSFVTCTLEIIDGREQMVWRNMSEREAQIFFDAYEVGIEHVGDILITRGLW